MDTSLPHPSIHSFPWGCSPVREEEEIPWLHLKAITLCWETAKFGLPAHGLGCCRKAHPVQTARTFFKPMLKHCFWCFSTTLEPGWMTETQQKASKGCPGLLPRQQQQQCELQAPPVHRAARRGTSVWTTGTHLGGNFSQGLQPGRFLQLLFYYPGHNP